MEPFKIQNTDLILKYLNCLERVFFIDNRWMKDYDDLKKGVERDYKGVSSYLSSLIKYFKEHNLSILNESLPNKGDIKKCDEVMNCIILESLNPSSFVPTNEEETQYVVVACPEIEKVFHFKAKSFTGDYLLRKATIKDFFYHPSLPRIKIYSKNFNTQDENAKLSELSFIYTLPSDASIQLNSFKIIENVLVWDELVPDPAYGVQVGNLSKYFISSIKLKQLKRNIENLHQLILICEDWEGKEYNFYITTRLYREVLKEFPEEKVYQEPIFLRILVFQDYGENFRHILIAELIMEDEYKADSFLAFVRFRKIVEKDKIPFIPKKLPSQIQEKENKYFYFPAQFSLGILETGEEFERTNKWPIPVSLVREYQKFNFVCGLHKGLLNLYHKREDTSNWYTPLEIFQPNPSGLHKELLRNPLDKFIFFAKNKRLIMFCMNCKKYKKVVKAEEIPYSCPICEARVLTMLEEFDDDKIIDKSPITQEAKRKQKLYEKLSTLFIPFYKPLYYTFNATGYGISICVHILNGLKFMFEDENEFLKKLFKVQEEYNKQEGIQSVLYKVIKNEV